MDVSVKSSSQVSISVLMPVYNGQAFLEDALKSVLDQTEIDSLEVLVIDDGSQDNSPQI